MSSEKPEVQKSNEAENRLVRHLQRLRSRIVHKPPYCQGTVALPMDEFTLFYGKEGNAQRMNLSCATTNQLQQLAEACAPAMFGLNQTNVLDETYRKAGKLDASDFSIKFDPERVGLVRTVRTELVEEGRQVAHGVRAELYKLNVYDKGAFFKAHVDTPRSENMFGSLVIVFPTKHEGGELVLRQHDGKGNTTEWVVDSTKLLKDDIGYVAFYSDIEHEVLPVRSGYRVTLTYNLYYVQEEPYVSPTIHNPIPTNADLFRDAVERALDDQAFLPQGGNLLFCLNHKYPLPTARGNDNEANLALQELAFHLKATDAMIWDVMDEFDLDACLKIVYRGGDLFDTPVLCSQVYPLEDEDRVETPLSDYLKDHAGGVEVINPSRYRSNSGFKSYERDLRKGKAIEAHWVNYKEYLFGGGAEKANFMAYGNEASIGVAYWKICMLVRVGPPGQRERRQ